MGDGGMRDLKLNWGEDGRRDGVVWDGIGLLGM